MSQAFQLISGPAINELLSASENRIGKLLGAGKSHEEILTELYWRALSRAPSEKERQAGLDYLKKSPDVRKDFEDIAWSLLNAKEFVLRQ